MSDIWYKPTVAPQALPYEDRDPSGLPWTDLANNEFGREQCGWVEAPEQPEIGPSQHAVWAGTEWTVEDVPAPLPPSRDALKSAVMVKRDAVIEGGFTFAGTRYQTAATDRENISGAAQLAFMAVVAGAQPGDLRWASPDVDFGWIAADNSVVAMDAPTVIAFGKAVAGFKQACIFHARGLKNEIEDAEDPSSIDIDAGWPG